MRFDNSLVDLAPTNIITSHNNITQGRSSTSTTESTSGAASWINQLAIASSGTAAFTSAPTGVEETRTLTVALPPIRLCTGTNGIASGGTGNVAEYAGCEQRTGNNLSNIDVPAPSATAVGDYLVAVVATDGNPTMTTPTGWTAINVGVSNTNDATLAVYGRMAATAGAGPYNFAWTGSTQDVFAYVMRFTNAAGVYATEVAAAVADSTNASTPTITTTVPNTLVVRVGAFDNQLVNLNPAAGAIIASHNNITQGRSSGDPANAVSSGAAWISQAVAGVSGTATFGSAPTAVEQTRTVTFGIRPNQRCIGTNSVVSTGPVQYEGCSQTEAAGNNTAITLTSPAATQVGDYLMAAITIDGDVTASIAPPVGWTAVNVGLANTSTATLAIYERLAGTAGAQNYVFDWTAGGNQEAFGYIMRFTGTPGFNAQATVSTGSGTNVSTPAVTTTVTYSTVVRIGGFDNNQVDLAPTSIMTGLGNIAQGRSSTLNSTESVSGGAAWSVLAATGGSGVVSFTSAPTVSAATRRQTIALPPTQLCTGTNAIPSGGDVEYAGCVQRTSSDTANVIVPSPAGTALGDYLLAVVAVDGNPTMTTPTGWTVIDVGVSNTNDATLAVYGRIAAAAGATNYTFAWTGSTQDSFAYVMQFTGAGGIDPSEVAVSVADSTNASTPTITTAIANTLVVRVGAFDNQLVNLNPATDAIVTGGLHHNITQGRSSGDPAAAVSSAAAWVNQAVAGASGTATFASAPTAVEQTRTVTLGIRPAQRCFATTSVFSTGPVQYEGCSQTQAAGANTQITLTDPAGTVAGDYLLAVVSTDGNTTIAEPAGWTMIDEGLGNASVNTLGIYGRVADATTSHIFTWAGGNEEAFGYIMRFTGTPGVNAEAVAALTGTVANATTPDVTTTVENSVVVRVGGFDSNVLDLAPTTIMAAYNNIIQGRSSGDAANSTSSAAAWINQIVAGASGTPNFTSAPTVADNTRRFTVAMPPYQLCTGTNATPSGGIVEYAGCIQSTRNSVAAITVNTPAATAIGDYLVAVVATDGNTSASMAAPVGWTEVDVDAGDGSEVTLGVYARFADTAGTQPHQFTWTGNEDVFAYIMRFTSTGGIDPTEVSSSNGTGTLVSTPAITTTVADTLIVRVGAFDNHFVGLNPTGIMPSHFNITQGRSSPDTSNSVSSAAAWVNQPAIGSSGTAAFGSAPTVSEQTRRLTFGLRPVPSHFRITHLGTGNTCRPSSITITAHEGNGVVDTAYLGTVDLSTDLDQGYWAIGNGNGELTQGSGDGTATYEFDSSDMGTVSLQFFSTAPATLNFDIVDGSGQTERALYDPSITITTCTGDPVLQQQVCENDGSVDIDINAETPYSNRLILVVVGRAGVLSGSATPPALTETFDGVDLTQVSTSGFINSGGNDTLVEMFMMREGVGQLPTAAGTYTTAAQPGGTITRTCVFYYEDMRQEDPVAPAFTTATNGTASLTITTSLTPLAGGNSLVLSGINATNDNVTYGTPAPPFSRLYTANGTGDGSLSTFATSGGVVAGGAPVNVTETSDINTDRRAHVVGAFRPALSELASFRITHSGTGNTCSASNVTITAIDQYGNTFTGYTGTIELDAGASGVWTESGGGNMTGGASDDGDATYQFVGGDNGVVSLTFTRATAGSVDIDVRDSVSTTIVESPFFDNPLVLGLCQFRITPSATGSICSPSTVQIGLYTPGGALVTNYTGTVTLSTTLVPGVTSGGGDWSQGTALGVLNNGTANDGIATYQFVVGDNGLATLNYGRPATATINFNVADGPTVEASGYDTNMVIGTCFFRIDHDDDGDVNADVCTPESVKITVVNSAGVTQTGYTGTVNITTSTNVGDWSKAVVTGFTNLGSGAASYTFQSGDNGVVTLNLTHHSTNAAVSVNLNSGSFQEEVGFDPPIEVLPCAIRFSLSSSTATTCTSATVTLGVYNHLGALATGYAGAVSLSTDTNHGTWGPDNGPGTIVDGSPGSAVYTFVAADGGDAEIVFSSTDIETLNFNAIANDGAITVDTGNPAYDPNLTITACLPTVSETACYANQSQMDAITLPSAASTSESRMVLMYVGSSSGTAATAARIDGQAMTLLRTEFADYATDTILQVYGILDVNLPDAAGDYDAEFDGSANSPAMCIVALQGVTQAFPTTAIPATAGRINGTNVPNTDPISTTITTNHNNSIVIGVAINSTGGTTYQSTLTEELWQANMADPAGADWAGHQGYQLAAGLKTVTDDASTTPATGQAQILLAIAPFIDGPPAVTDYVPVTLFRTFAGNVNYRAIGNTLRLNSFPCDMITPNTLGSVESLSLPPNSTIRAAYLYWAGSGYEADVDQVVKFGVDGSPNSINLADQVFIIEPNIVFAPEYDPVPEGYFAAYKDVTGYFPAPPATFSNTPVSYRFSDLTVREDDPWAEQGSCVSGWALVVVYENANEPLNVINLFHGFQPFYHSAFTLVPRNFRMATPDGPTGNKPHAQVTHVTFEGDSNIVDADEVLQLQNDPLTLNFSPLYNDDANPFDNPVNNQYNGTFSQPNYDGALNFTGTYTTKLARGVDVDTYYIAGANNGDFLYPFGAYEAEQITTRYSTGEDIVLLTGEFIAVTNAPIADLEIFVTDSGIWKVGSMGTAAYRYQVTNNGNGAVTGGYANGDVVLTGNMPDGITIDAINADGWDCSLQTSTAFTCVFEIATSWTPARGAAIIAQLAKDESLPTVEVVVDIGDETDFPLLNNDVTTVGRIAHVGNYSSPPGVPAPCPAESAGVQPNPNPATGCSKSPQFDNVNDLNKFLIDIDDLDEKTATNNNVHHRTRNVRGVETDLSMNKAVSGILEANQPATYTLSVHNAGPDATTGTITVTDTLPAGLTLSLASGSTWDCSTSAGQNVVCTRTTPLSVGGNAPAITVTTAAIASPAVEGAFVSNTATVTTGLADHDTVPGNNSDTDISEVTGPLAEATEKFLISVTEDGTTIGGLTFNDGDIVLYDPVTEIATMFLAESSIPDIGPPTDLGNIDAMHLLPNGKILLSTATDGSVIAGVTFNAEDIVMYDPILQTAVLIFDGSTIFTADTVDIDAIHIRYNSSYTVTDWDILLSTAASATFSAGISFQDNDIVSYDMGSGTGTLLVDGASADMFNGATGNLNGVQVRYNNSNKYIVSTSSSSPVTIATSGETLTYERGEVVEVDVTTPGDPLTTALLCDDQAPCVGDPAAIFTPVSPTRRLDAFHMIETGYFGHFSITSAGGDACSPTSITIRKHAGLTHNVEAHYGGSIRISNNVAMGSWAKDVTADGTLYTTGYGLGPGEAIYTFAPGAMADNGAVVLYVTGVDATNTFNVNITNGFVVENNPSEDSNIVIGEQVTEISYADDFDSVAYTANDGAAGFATPWTETDDDSNAATGHIRIVTDTDELRFNNLFGVGQPSLTRGIDFGVYGVDAPPQLSFDWRIAGNPTGSFVVEAKDGNDVGWTALNTFNASSGSGTASYTLPPTVYDNGTTLLRFRIASGYSAAGTEFFYVDDVAIETETHDCGVGGDIDHYSITHVGTMVSCMAEDVTITPHTIGELATEPPMGTIIMLNTSTSKGYWGPPTNGLVANFTAGDGNGQATYEYAGETSLTFPFYYTDLAGNSETVTFSAYDTSVPINYSSPGESDTMVVSKTGLRFVNESGGGVSPNFVPDFPTLVAGMPSNTRLGVNGRPGNILTVQAIQTSPVDPTVCEAVFADNTVVDVELAFECIDPTNCSSSTVPVQVLNSSNALTDIEPVDNNSGNGANAGGYTAVPLLFTDVGAYNRAQLILNYADAGAMQIHGRFNIQVQNQAGTLVDSNDYMAGSGDTFVVRPFAFAVDFTVDADGAGGAAPFQDRAARGNLPAALSWADDATDVNGMSEPSYFHTAGNGFDTTVRALVWEAADDVNNDGVPDANANLYNNVTTPNFGNEVSTAVEDATITHTRSAIMPMGSVDGTLTDRTFTDFTNGVALHTMTYSEVGIIDLTVALDANYLGGGEGVTGFVKNLGRFIPAKFLVSTPTLTPRPLFTPSTGPFTYLGEQFGVSFTLTAQNDANVAVTNYFGDFAKLKDQTNPVAFYAVDDVTGATDMNHTTFATPATLCNGVDNNNRRLCQPTTGGFDFTVGWPTAASAGAHTFTGRLILARQLDEVEQAPLTDVQIGLTVIDKDAVRDVLNAMPARIQLDDSADDAIDAEYNLLATHQFRYGRLRLENGYGTDLAGYYDHDDDDDGVNPSPTPEIPMGHDVMVRVVAEYYDGARFIANPDDVATPYDSDDLDFVTGTFTDNLADSTAPYDADDEAVVTDINGKIYQGETRETTSQTDIPFYLRAPLDEGNEGSALVELNLDGPTPRLSFLKYNWRSAANDEDVIDDGDVATQTDNPRALVEFGRFGGNDRIINWQEIFR